MVGEGRPSTPLIREGNPWMPPFAGMTDDARQSVDFNTGWY
jgi:hypothetical protein